MYLSTFHQFPVVWARRGLDGSSFQLEVDPNVSVEDVSKLIAEKIEMKPGRLCVQWVYTLYVIYYKYTYIYTYIVMYN